MARKPKRRPIRRHPQDQTEHRIAEQRRLDMAAYGLLNGRSPDQLQSELHDRELLLTEADRVAQMDPSPVNLANYRAARSQVQAARRAIEIASHTPAGD